MYVCIYIYIYISFVMLVVILVTTSLHITRRVRWTLANKQVSGADTHNFVRFSLDELTPISLSLSLCICILYMYIYIYVYMCMCVYIYIYIYIERDIIPYTVYIIIYMHIRLGVGLASGSAMSPRASRVAGPMWPRGRPLAVMIRINNNY